MRGKVQFTDPEALAVFIGKIIETSTALFVVSQTGDSEWTVEFDGGY